MIRPLGALFALALLWPARAEAYRPFDETDADVAAQGELELELGPTQVIHSQGTWLYDPGLVLNVGVLHRMEIVLNTQATFLSPPAGDVFNGELTAKFVLRNGCLQGATGPSVATEVGVLLPPVGAEGHFGASGAVIASQRWPAATVHLNGYVADSRLGQLDLVGGAIIEGPFDWTVRPVSEFWFEHVGAQNTGSGLLGAIFSLRENLTVDVAVRTARSDGQDLLELRAGFTFGVSIFPTGEPEPSISGSSGSPAGG
ncbi:MAG: hypothetical protein JST54_07340 [Deltaproteobacteria bacterium]|nr:hypothetical protein [Deltaproteobacteria bacterium]